MSPTGLFVYFSVCPTNVTITEGNKELTCRADSATVYYKWTDNIEGSVYHGETYPLAEGDYNVTCTARIINNCTERYNVCQHSLIGSDPGFPYSGFGRTAPNNTVDCAAISANTVGCKYYI